MEFQNTGDNSAMKSNTTVFAVLTAIIAVGVQAAELTISVTNPSSVARENEPVVVFWRNIAAKIPSPNIELRDEQGNALPVQVDDVDLDGTPDELTFVATFSAGEERTFTVQQSVRKREWPPRTDAQNFKRIIGEGGRKILQPVDDDDVPGAGRERKAYRFDGVGWESEVVGYRLYLDERNATDIQGKRKPGIYWKWIGESGVDYQLDADWGMDVLHVGPALGIGGIAFWVGDSVLKPLVIDRQRTRIVARGPVRAVVRVEYKGWDIGTEKADLTSLFSIYAGDRVSTHRVMLEKGPPPSTIVTGIVTHDSTEVVWNPDQAWLYTIGHQSRASDTLLMALTVPAGSVIKKTEDGYNQLVLLNIEENEPLDILISSYWQGETGRMWGPEELDSFLQGTSRRLNEPLGVSIR